jgi:hypothetical protein
MSEERDVKLRPIIRDLQKIQRRNLDLLYDDILLFEEYKRHPRDLPVSTVLSMIKCDLFSLKEMAGVLKELAVDMNGRAKPDNPEKEDYGLYEFVAHLSNFFKHCPKQHKSNLAAFLDRHRGNLFSHPRWTGCCPLEIGCRKYVNGFCACVCTDLDEDGMALLREMVKLFQDKGDGMGKRAPKCVYVTHFDKLGSIAFKSDWDPATSSEEEEEEPEND